MSGGPSIILQVFREYGCVADVLADRNRQVDGLVEQAVVGLRPGQSVVLEYVRTQMDFSLLFPHLIADNVPVSYHNATLRSAAERLRYLGIPVVWRYAEVDLQ